MPALYSARTGYRTIREAGTERIRAKSLRQTDRLIELAESAGLRVPTPRDHDQRGGTVLVESVFTLPGLGGLAVTRTFQHDLPVIQGVAVLFAGIVVAINLFVDLAYAWANPKVRA